jgi:hypothetical protein
MTAQDLNAKAHQPLIDFEHPPDETPAAWIEAVRLQFDAQAGHAAWAEAADAWARLARISQGERDRQIFTAMADLATRNA